MSNSSGRLGVRNLSNIDDVVYPLSFLDHVGGGHRLEGVAGLASMSLVRLGLGLCGLSGVDEVSLHVQEEVEDAEDARNAQGGC